MYNLTIQQTPATRNFIKNKEEQNMKRILALALAAVMTLGLTACGGGSKPASSAGNSGSSAAASTSQPAATGDATEISLWTYPIGGWGDEKQVN